MCPLPPSGSQEARARSEGILASIAEFYSANLSQEIRKGLDQKRGPVRTAKAYSTYLDPESASRRDQSLKRY
jgi:DNA invertase Pin-like site-specific DNA recombinase